MIIGVLLGVLALARQKIKAAQPRIIAS